MCPSLTDKMLILSIVATALSYFRKALSVIHRQREADLCPVETDRSSPMAEVGLAAFADYSASSTLYHFSKALRLIGKLR